MADETKPLSLTDLAQDLDKLNRALQRHTKTRNYLWRITCGEEIPPILSVPNTEYEIDLNRLPEDTLMQLLVALIEHEERCAFAVWKEIERVGKESLNVIDIVKKAREAAAKAPPEEAEDVGLRIASIDDMPREKN